MYSSYRVISFGDSDNGRWTSPRYFSDELSARLFFEEIKYDPEVVGVYLVRVRTQDWTVLSEYNTQGMSIGMTPQGGITVTKAPQLVLV